MSAQDSSANVNTSAADKGKGKAVDDVSMGENEDSSSEEEAEDAPARHILTLTTAEEVEEEASDNEIDPSNIIAGGRRTRGKQIDFAKAAKELPADDDEDDEDDDFEGEGEEDEDEHMEGN
ncbi:Histone chaperone domain CHZ protein [Rutstroemia sp. NJR-2017a WRK4]|nr:Histone chaperone domain CHZ protein [Rutstroemia sp. NJR-2017a WRK4]